MIFAIAFFCFNVNAQNEIPSDGLELWLKAMEGVETTTVDGEERVGKWSDVSSGKEYYINKYSNNGGDYITDRGNPSSYVEILTSNTTDDDYIVVGETDEMGLVFDNAPEDTRIWNKKFFINKNGNFDFNISFDIKAYEGKDNTNSGSRTADDYSLVYSTDNGSSYTVVKELPTADLSDPHKVTFTVTNANFEGNGFYTLASTAPIAFYAKSSGNWSSKIWTDKPSGDPSDFDGVPSSRDNVFILSGKTVTINSNNTEAAVLEVNEGATLKFGASTGHKFEEVNGQGIIELESDNFPEATLNYGFLSEKGGTVKFTGTGAILSTVRSYHNVDISLTNSTDVLRLQNDFSLTGNLIVSQGELKIGSDNDGDAAVKMLVNGDAKIQESGSLSIGTGDVIHELTFGGDFENAGTVNLTKRDKIGFTIDTQAYLDIVETYYSDNTSESGQFARVIFNAGDKDQNLICNGSTIFYQLVIDKGSNDSYILNIDSKDKQNFEMYGYNIHNNGSTGDSSDPMDVDNGMFVLKFGTLRFGNNIYIPSYSNSTNNYDLNTETKLWVDGGNVNFGPVNALTVYGSLLVTSGRLNIGLELDGTSNGKHNSIILREKGFVTIKGGEVYLNQFNTSSNRGDEHQGSFTMSGGEMIIYGYISPDSDNGIAAFSLPYTTNSFDMSGGKITIHNEGTNIKYLTKFAMSDGYYNVTGGEIVFDLTRDDDVAFISSIPFYDLSINIANASNKVSLSKGTDSFGDDLPNNGDLKILRNLLVEEGSTLEIGDFDMTVGRAVLLRDNARLNIGSSNSLTFNDSNSEVTEHYIDIQDTDEAFSVDNLVIDFENTSSVFEVIDLNIPATSEVTKLKVLSSLTIAKGIFDYHDYIVEVQGNLTFGGKLGTGNSTGYLKLSGTTTQSIKSTYDLVSDQIADTTKVGISHLWLNNTKGVDLSSIIYATKLTWEQGLIKANEYGVVIGAEGIEDQVGTVIIDATDNDTKNRRIIGSGRSSDGGLTYLIQSGIDSYYYPLASDRDDPADGTKFTPAILSVDTHTDEGFVQLTSHNGNLSIWTSIGTEESLIDYYWKSSNFGFNDKPKISWVFEYHEEDERTEMSSFIAGRVQIEAGNSVREALGSGFDEPNQKITTSSVTAYDAFYSAGLANEFDGSSLAVYYSFQGMAEGAGSIPQGARWNHSGRWTTNADWKNTGNPLASQGIPGAGDIIVIGHGRYGNNSVTEGHRIVIDNGYAAEAGIIRFDSHESATAQNADLARIRLDRGSLDVKVVENVGSLRIHEGNTFNYEDLNDFLNQSRSEIMLEANSFNMEIINFPKYPNVRLYGGNGSNGSNFTFASDAPSSIEFEYLMIDGGTLTLDRSITVNDSINVGGYKDAIFNIDSDTPISIEAKYINLENTINSGAVASNKFQVVDQAVEVIHTLIVKENITIPQIDASDSGEENIVFDLNQTNAKVILELQGTKNGVFDNYYSGTVTPELYKIVMNKGGAKDATFTFNTNFSLETSTTEEMITLSNGTLVLDNADINITPYSVPAVDWNMASTSGLTINQGTVNIVGDEANLFLGGKLTVAGGTLNLSNAGEENSIIYNGSGEIEITDGTVNIGSEFRRGDTAEGIAVLYKQSGGVFNVGLIGNPTRGRGTFEVMNASSKFEFSGGEIIVNKGGITLDPAVSTVADSAIIKLGNASSSENISADFKNEVGELALVGDTYVTIVTNDVKVTGNVIIPSTATLDLSGKDLLMAGNLTNEGTLTATSSTLSFVSRDDQSVTGEVTAQNITIDAEGATVTINNDITVTNELNINAGTLSDNENTINVNGDLTVIGTHLSTGASLGKIEMNGTSKQYVYITGELGRIEINNSNGVELTNDLNLVAKEVIFNQGVLDIKSFAVKLNNDVVLTEQNPFGVTNMIQVDGGVGDKGIDYVMPTFDIPSEVIIPLGVDGLYTPIGFVGNYGGVSVVLKIVNAMHPVAENTDGTTDDALSQYWRLEFSEDLTANDDDRLITIQYTESKVKGDETTYEGVIVDDDANIIKPIHLNRDFVNNKIEINLNSGLKTGDYFAGTPDSTPDDIIRYRVKDSVMTSYLKEASDGQWEVSTDGGTTYTDLTGTTTINSGTILHIREGTKLYTSSDGSLGYRSFYKAFIEGEFEIHQNDKDILINSVELSEDATDAGTVIFYLNEGMDGTGQMPSGNWGEFYNAGGLVHVKGTATSATLDLEAPLNNSKFNIGGLKLEGTSSSEQTWSLSSGRGLNITFGDLEVNGVNLELSTASTLNNIIVSSDGKLTSNDPSLPSTASGDVAINSDGELVIEESFSISGNTNLTNGILTVNNASLDIVGNLVTSGASSSITLNGGELALSGDFTLSSDTDVSLTGSKLLFEGTSSNQTLNGALSGTKAINELVINKASGKVIFENGIKEFNKITLNSVLRNTGVDGTLLMLGNSSDITGTSFVEGPFSKKLTPSDKYFLFPTGRGNKPRYLEVDYISDTGSSAQEEKTWSVEYTPARKGVNPETDIHEDSGLENVSSEYQWRVTDLDDGEPSFGDKASLANIRFYLGDLDLSQSNKLILASLNENELSDSERKWKKAASITSHYPALYFESLNVSFSEKILAIASVIEEVDLPVKMISFNGYYENNTVVLEWTTATELNNDNFEVQRSVDGQNWSSLVMIEGGGNSNVRLDYQYVDNDPIQSQLTYYRLIQTDFDGTATVIDPIQVYANGEAGLADFTIYPNPTQGGNVNLILKAWGADVEIVLYNSLGYKVLSDTWRVGDSNFKELQLSKVPRGVYLIKLKSGNTIKTKRVII
ncbi:T9SS type A sorting domain-containing protein [Flammeovirga aprica]|uniref:T9SS type A sorting domain-containing protein n=1 Tax=Flammeovirga aprica JL-4 TaxID=694437 RepID=A0A7X9S0V1_9BACT|nr:T9SS type A sorting domain-containing protein [Flammeovirga aprica]NME72189.1 T9SS type A sorting domain-containing protein [Flammeovirga aprica JL-4]